MSDPYRLHYPGAKGVDLRRSVKKSSKRRRKKSSKRSRKK